MVPDQSATDHLRALTDACFRVPVKQHNRTANEQANVEAFTTAWVEAREWLDRSASDAEKVLRSLVDGHKRNATTSKNDGLTEWQKDSYEAALDVLRLPRDYLDLDRAPTSSAPDEERAS